MSDCCSSNSSFPTANAMEQLATNNTVVWEEISAIQQAILSASSQCQVAGGQMCTTVGGNTPMTFVSGIVSVNVISGGSGYEVDYPAVSFVPPYGSTATGAIGTLTTNGSSIQSITVTNGSAGYQPILASLTISSVAGTGAIIQPLVNASGQIISVNIVNSGAGYTINDSIIASRAVMPNASYINATFLITAVSITGSILSIAILNPGSGYQPSTASVNIVSTLAPSMVYPTGTGFNALVLTDANGTITGVTVLNGGYGYSKLSPYLVISDPGQGATTTVTLSGASVSAVSVITPGTNYTQTPVGTILNPSTAPAPNPPASPSVLSFTVSNNTYGTNPLLYWQVFVGTTTNKPISVQINAVISYFKSLGYTIAAQSNPATGTTIQWKICW